MPLILQRKRVLIQPRIQLRLVGSFLAAACISTIIQILLLNLALGRVAAEVPAAGATVLESTPAIIRTQVLLTFGLMAPLVVAVGILETFRIVGPLHRFERYLRDIAEGRRPEPCKIRKDDELQEFCTLLNQATQPAIEAQRAAEAAPVELEDVPSLVRTTPAPTTVVLD